jgi:hypothetical protein
MNKFIFPNKAVPKVWNGFGPELPTLAIPEVVGVV